MEYLVSEAKIVSYLLMNPVKCGFFLPQGYSVEHWKRLRDDILKIAINFPARSRRHMPHGDEVEIIGEVQSPNGKMIRLRTGWMIRDGEAGVMCFVTAYPA